MDRSTGHGRLLAAFLAGAAVLMAGCSTSTPSAGAAIPGTASPSAVATTSSPSTSPTPTTSATPASCQSGQLSVLLGASRKRGGAAYYPIEFQNIQATSCTLDGFPDVSFFGQNDSVQVGPAATRNQASPEHPVGLAPEGSAIAQLEVVNAKNYPSRCRQTTVSGISVSPPGLTHSVRLPLSSVTCKNPRYHVLIVSAVVEGPPPPQGD